jgi:hypothetical protein
VLTTPFGDVLDRRVLDDIIGDTALRVPKPVNILSLEPGRVVGLVGDTGTGLTRLGMHMLAEASQQAPVAMVDLNGWINPLAAWEVGIAPERLVMVREVNQDQWADVMGVLLRGVPAVYAEVPPRTSAQVLRRIASSARKLKTSVVLRSPNELPSGVAHLMISSQGVVWTGTEAGYGYLGVRDLLVGANGRGVGGRNQALEVEDDGTDTLRVVGRVGASSS